MKFTLLKFIPFPIVFYVQCIVFWAFRSFLYPWIRALYIRSWGNLSWPLPLLIIINISDEFMSYYNHLRFSLTYRLIISYLLAISFGLTLTQSSVVKSISSTIPLPPLSSSSMSFSCFSFSSAAKMSSRFSMSSPIAAPDSSTLSLLLRFFCLFARLVCLPLFCC